MKRPVTLSLSPLAAQLRILVARLAEGSRPLTILTFASIGLLLASLLGQWLDPRQVLGASTWLKPAKFAVSVAINAGTLALLLGWLQPRSRGVRRAARMIAALLALELVIITAQAARGVPSHFNSATPLDVALFSIMGAAISVVWGGLVYLGWRSLRQPFSNRALGWGIRLGFIAVILGAGLGFLMPRPTPTQLESLAASRPTPTIGAHAVGVEDGGPGLPITRWSTEGGDLRVPHFVGMHGLQLLPLAGWLLSRRRRAARASRLVAATAVGYLGLTAVLLLQALRAQPLLAPDGWTWLSLAVVVSAATWLATRAARAQLGQPATAHRSFA